MKILIAIVTLAALTGCATTDTSAFYAAQRDAETAKYSAITALANGADPTTRALLAVMIGGGMAGGQGGMFSGAAAVSPLLFSPAARAVGRLPPGQPRPEVRRGAAARTAVDRSLCRFARVASAVESRSLRPMARRARRSICSCRSVP